MHFLRDGELVGSVSDGGAGIDDPPQEHPARWKGFCYKAEGTDQRLELLFGAGQVQLPFGKAVMKVQELVRGQPSLEVNGVEYNPKELYAGGRPLRLLLS